MYKMNPFEVSSKMMDFIKFAREKETETTYNCTDLSMTTRKQGDYFDLKEVMLIIVVKLPAL